MGELKLYRKRIIPQECILLEDDILLYRDNEVIITKWNTIRPKKTLSHGYSCYFLERGFKVSKFYDHDDQLISWYCDIIDTAYSCEDGTETYIFTDLLADSVVEGGHTGVEDVGGPYGFTTWWELVDHTHVEIAIEGHGERAWDGCGSHHQHVGRICALTPELGTLSHTKTVLFVDDNKPQTCELHRVLDNGMGAYKDLYGAVEQSFQHFLTSFAFHDTCQEGYAQVHVFQETHHCLQVLLNLHHLVADGSSVARFPCPYGFRG